jgi:uncharacterized protein (DUF58 family)
MGVGAHPKLRLARRVAAAVTYAAIKRRDAVGFMSFSDRVVAHFGAASGTAQLTRVLRALETPDASGAAAIDSVLMRYGASIPAPAVVAVISDFLDAEPGIEALRYLRSRGLAVTAIQVLAAEEREPQLAQETELVDVERPRAEAVVANAASVARYRRRLAEHLSRFAGACRTHGISRLTVASDTPFSDVLIALRSGGLLALHG